YGDDLQAITSQKKTKEARRKAAQAHDPKQKAAAEEKAKNQKEVRTTDSNLADVGHKGEKPYKLMGLREVLLLRGAAMGKLTLEPKEAQKVRTMAEAQISRVVHQITENREMYPHLTPSIFEDTVGMTIKMAGQIFGAETVNGWIDSMFP